ncbi:hypothetical protein RhiirA4_430697 [Rhizophagus irregularis]|uniref:Uncharacterized protein n=1 Tax=Rhizophagus irregularis TaxID=588596 RepID=A0A2I1HLS8_9GLOM|nr:hypothetical protein RhiirA4_430697 [Rhizophagus irregularis]
MHTLKDIKNRGHRLGSAYEQELEKKIRTAIDFNSGITNFNEKLQAEYSEREKEFENKVSQLIASSTKREERQLWPRKLRPLTSRSKKENFNFMHLWKLIDENRSLIDQLALKKEPKDTSSQIISSEGIPLELGGAEAVPLFQEIPLALAIPVVASFLMSPMITYSMLALLLIVVIWLVVRKWWNPWGMNEKNDRYFIHENI